MVGGFIVLQLGVILVMLGLYVTHVYDNEAARETTTTCKL